MLDVVRSRAARSAKLAGLIVLVALASTGCSVTDVLAFGWPEGVTPQAERMRELWIWAVVASLVVGAIVWALIAWSVAFHRKKKTDSDELPKQFQYNLTLEVVYTAIPFIIVVVLFLFTISVQNYVHEERETPDVAVDVVGFQWNWEFTYLQPGGGEPMTGSGGQPISTVGTASTVPLLVVPTERVVEYRLRSVDVLHSFYVPEFLFKRDVFPNPGNNNTDNTFQTTVDTPGAFVGRCAELCGTYHSAMNFEVRALPPDLFDRYLQLRRQMNPDTRQPFTAGDALAALNCGELCAPRAVTTAPFDTDRQDREASGVGDPRASSDN